MKKFIYRLGGALAGILNGLLGAGGGMILVPILKKNLETRKAHATSIAIILPITTVSAVFYYYRRDVTFSDATPYIIWGLIGALIGIFLLSNVKPIIIRKLFALLMLWAAWRLITK